MTPEVVDGGTEWRVPEEVLDKIGLGDGAENEEETRRILRRSLRSDDPAVRMASITALGRLAGRFEWAIDGLVEVLVRGRGRGGQGGRPSWTGSRRGPAHAFRRCSGIRAAPCASTRCGCSQATSPWPRRHLPAMIEDRSANVRAAALESLCATSRRARRFAAHCGCSTTPSPVVRAQASRTATAVAPLPAASFVVPLLVDPSWWVRKAAREGLVAAGRDVARCVAPALESDDAALSGGAALVMQDIGLVDDLVADDDPGRWSGSSTPAGDVCGTPQRSGATGITARPRAAVGAEAACVTARHGRACSASSRVLATCCLVYASYIALMVVGYFESRRRRHEFAVDDSTPWPRRGSRRA